MIYIYMIYIYDMCVCVCVCACIHAHTGLCTSCYAYTYTIMYSIQLYACTLCYCFQVSMSPLQCQPDVPAVTGPNFGGQLHQRQHIWYIIIWISHLQSCSYIFWVLPFLGWKRLETSWKRQPLDLSWRPNHILKPERSIRLCPFFYWSRSGFCTSEFSVLKINSQMMFQFSSIMFPAINLQYPPII